MSLSHRRIISGLMLLCTSVIITRLSDLGAVPLDQLLLVLAPIWLILIGLFWYGSVLAGRLFIFSTTLILVLRVPAVGFQLVVPLVLVLPIILMLTLEDWRWTLATALLTISGLLVRQVLGQIALRPGIWGVLVGILTIVTLARVLHDQAIRRERASLAQFRAIIDGAMDAIITIDAQQRITIFNRAAEQMFGYAAAAVQGQPLDMLLPERFRAPHRAHVMALQSTRFTARLMGEAALPTLYGLRASGQEFPIEASISQIAVGATPLLTATVRDVTHSRRMEQQFLQAQKMEVVGQLAGGVAHDFNNLLTAITGYAEFALEALPPDQEVTADLHEILKASRRATQLTQQLLAFSRRQPIAPTVLQLNDLLRDLERLLQRLLPEDITLVLEPAEPLAAVLVDSSQIEQVLINLVINARDAMPRGGTLTITTANVVLDPRDAPSPLDVPPGRYVLLAVCDTGVGMAEEVRAHLFEPFFTTKPPGQGTGLGLATCYGIVKQHGGALWVESELEWGTIINVAFPQVAVDSPAAPAPGEEKAALPRGHETVLVVEDAEAVRRLAVRVLRTCGYRVLEAANGLQALKRAQAHAPAPIDLLLTDVVMPELGGPATAGEIQARYPGIAVLYMSGYPEHATLVQGQVPAGGRLLAKPFTPATLARTVREVLDVTAPAANKQVGEAPE